MISTTRSMAPMGILPSTERTSLMWPSRSIATVGVRSISCIAGVLPQSEIANGWRSWPPGRLRRLEHFSYSKNDDPRPVSAGRTKDRRVDRDRHRPPEQANDHLDTLGRVQLPLENRIDHCQRTALDHHR